MNTSCLDEKLSSAASIVSIVLSLWFSLSGLAAVTGNAVVMWLFYKHESLRTISNRFLVSLSVAFVDRRRRSETHILFNVTDILWIHTTASTTFNLCCVSVDRFIAVRFPFRYQEILTKKACYTVIGLVWFTCGLSHFLFLSRSWF